MGSREPGDQVPRRRQAEGIGHRLGRLARRAEGRGEAQVPRTPYIPHHGGTKAAGDTVIRVPRPRLPPHCLSLQKSGRATRSRT